MQGLRDPSFLLKKNSAPAADKDGQMSPVFSEVSMYSFNTALSPETEQRRPLGIVQPRIRSMVQSYGRCGGRDMALVLLNTSRRW